MRKHAHVTQRGKLIDQEQKLVSIRLLISLVELHRLRQPVNNDRKNQPHERREPVAIAIRHHQIKRDGPFVVDQILN